jgi:glycosyltransferase involved in cell wall biosynthesis
VLEAMACGCPVVTCRNSALPEAADDAAIYVGEDSPLELAQAMRDVLDEETRAGLIARGLAWSARFRWNETARALAAAILDAADNTRAER